MTEQTDLATVQNDVKWLIEKEGRSFKAALALIVVGLMAIFGAGANFQKLESHIDSDHEKHEALNQRVNEIQKQMIKASELKILEILGDTSATVPLEEMRKEFEKELPPIYAGLGGEES